MKSYVDTKRRAKLSKTEVGREKPHSWSLPKRVLSDPLQLVKRIGPATFRLYRMIPLDVTVDWFAR